MDPFKEWDKGFDADKIAMEEASKVIVDLFKSLRKHGLSTFEAAQVVAAMMANTGTNPPPTPPEIDHDEPS